LCRCLGTGASLGSGRLSWSGRWSRLLRGRLLALRNGGDASGLGLWGIRQVHGGGDCDAGGWLL